MKEKVLIFFANNLSSIASWALVGFIILCVLLYRKGEIFVPVFYYLLFFLLGLNVGIYAMKETIRVLQKHKK